MPTTENSTTGSKASRLSSQPRRSAGPRRSAPICRQTIGSHSQGSRKSASPPQMVSGAIGCRRNPVARSPWNVKDCQPWVAFHQITGVNIATARIRRGPGGDMP